MKRSLFLVVAASLACALACKKPEPRRAYGDPIGVRADDPSDPSSASSLEAAFAVSAGSNGAPLIPGVARALHRAAKSCPALLALTKRGDTLRLEGRLENGHFAPNADATAEPEAECVRKAVASEPLEDGGAPLDLVLEIAAPHVQGTP